MFLYPYLRGEGAFTRLRDTNLIFDHCKEIDDVGIPAFVFEDGRVSIDPADAGLVEYGGAHACSIEDHKRLNEKVISMGFTMPMNSNE